MGKKRLLARKTGRPAVRKELKETIMLRRGKDRPRKGHGDVHQNLRRRDKKELSSSINLFIKQRQVENEGGCIKELHAKGKLCWERSFSQGARKHAKIKTKKNPAS